MSDSWNVPSLRSNCNISIIIEKINAIFPLFHTTFSSSPNVHITPKLNGTIMITFSMHSVVSCRSPFTVSQIHQSPMTLDNGFIQRFLFNRVRNRIIEVTKDNRNSLRKKVEVLKVVNQVWIATFQPLPELVGT